MAQRIKERGGGGGGGGGGKRREGEISTETISVCTYILISREPISGLTVLGVA